MNVVKTIIINIIIITIIIFIITTNAFILVVINTAIEKLSFVVFIMDTIKIFFLLKSLVLINFYF